MIVSYRNKERNIYDVVISQSNFHVDYDIFFDIRYKALINLNTHFYRKKDYKRVTKKFYLEKTRIHCKSRIAPTIKE